MMIVDVWDVGRGRPRLRLAQVGSPSGATEVGLVSQVDGLLVQGGGGEMELVHIELPRWNGYSCVTVAEPQA